ncbi:MAG: ASKHA domain-containing protein [Acidimicrobiales bacterium]|nr:ASKHA domain-containing protein [Acidimicrobiales bacterium]
MSSEHRVIFTPSGLEGRASEGTTALDLARQLGVDLDSVCGGRGICGRCQVVPSFGEFSKWAVDSNDTHLSAPNATEGAYNGKRAIERGARLGCQTNILGDVVLDVPPASQLHAAVIRKEINLAGLVLDPVSTLHVISIPKPELGSSSSLTEAVRAALVEEWSLEVDGFKPEALRSLQTAAGQTESILTVQVRRSMTGSRVESVRPGVSVELLGVAVDVGSTTIAGHLLDLATGEVLATGGLMNPQIRLGEDLMSRVSYAMMNADGDKELTRVVREAISELIQSLVTEANVDVSHVAELVMVGNPVMHHLLLGLDPTPLGQAPFLLATTGAVELPAKDLDFPTQRASVYVPPCIAGHVGADTAAVILAEGPHRSPEIQLLVDIGTNAEIVLGNEERLCAASSPTGPAFEGAQISCGQRAIPGAIERVRIDRETFEAAVKPIGCDIWSNEPGFLEATRGTGITGICGSGIVEAIAEMFLSGLMTRDGVILDSREKCDWVVENDRTFSYVLYPATDQTHGQPVVITQNDVRAIQLAKAALRAGIDLLMEHAHVEEVDMVRLAGAFGAHIDPVYAMVLGLIPDCALPQVRAVGNAAGSGAVRMLISREQRLETEEVVQTVEKIETATEPRFQQLFVDAMAFPHATLPTPHLNELVDFSNVSVEPVEARRRNRNRPQSVNKEI